MKISENNWKKNLFIIWIAQFITMLAMNMITPFLSLYVRDLGILGTDNVAKWSGFIFSAPFLLSIFFVPFWGYLGDKYGRKKMVIRALLGLAISQFLIGLSSNVYHLLFARLLQGALSGFLPAAMALVATNTPSEKTGYAIGLMQSSTSAGTVLGPLIGGLLYDAFGFKYLFFIITTVIIISAFIVYYLVEEFVKVSTSKSSVKLKDNFIFAIKNKNISIILISLIFSQIALSFLQPIFPLYIETLNISPKYIGSITGIFFGVTGFFLIFSAPIWGKINDKSNPIKNTIYASIIASLSYIIHFFIFNPILLIITRAMLGIGLGGINPVLFSLISKNAPSERKGGILGYGSSAQVLGNLLGPTLSGIIASQTSIRTSFLFSGFFALMIGFLLINFLRQNSNHN